MPEEDEDGEGRELEEEKGPERQRARLSSFQSRAKKGRQWKRWKLQPEEATEENVGIREVAPPPRVTKMMDAYKKLSGGQAFDIRMVGEERWPDMWLQQKYNQGKALEKEL